MAIYRQIHTCFWEDDKVMDEMDLKERFFYLYLLTNSRVKQCGCYDISWKKVSMETTLSKNEIQELLDKFENEFNLIKYNKKTKEVLILKFYKYNWTASPKVKACIKAEIEDIKDKEFASYIEKIMKEKYGIENLDRVSIPLGEKDNIREDNIKEKKRKEETTTTTPIFEFSTILEYGRSKGATDDYCKKFFDYYEDKNWKSGKIKIKDWKSKFDEWLKEDKIENNISELKKVSDGAYVL